MASSLYTPSPIHNSITFVTNQVPNPHAQFIYHYNHFYFSPHPSMFVYYYPFWTEMNKGYAFVNFTTAKAVSKFMAACNYKPWRYFCSNKELEITSARIQGKDELTRRFEKMTYPSEEFTAVCFSPARSGGKITVQTMMVGK